MILEKSSVLKDWVSKDSIPRSLVRKRFFSTILNKISLGRLLIKKVDYQRNECSFPYLVTLFFDHLTCNKFQILPILLPRANLRMIVSDRFRCKFLFSKWACELPTTSTRWLILDGFDVISHRNSRKYNSREKSLKPTFSLNGCEYSCLASRKIKFRIEVPSRVKSSHFSKDQST